jgi:hypothetical protein
MLKAALIDHVKNLLPMLRSSAALPSFGVTDGILNAVSEEAQSDDGYKPGWSHESQLP